MLGAILLCLATVAVLHAAFSTYEHLSHLKAMGRPEGALPTDIIFEALLALVLGTIGASINTPNLKEITWAAEMRKRSIDEMDSRLGFASFVNRGTNLFSDPAVHHPKHLQQ
ncbi:magnesium transporter [Mycena belliarum]|uniref:Magnesium transporter n=1 Tax=Mycena belliarum TaxID=1033014 RepID=A0AAD6U7Y1_9AGAR|nr:magnesium transporter [Mycena belliae]